jgi:hypothetical protein
MLMSPASRTDDRRAALAELSASITATIGECRYHHNVVKLAAKFDEV